MNEQIEQAITIIEAEWKKSVGNYRTQNPKKLDWESALDAAIQALRAQQECVQYPMADSLAEEALKALYELNPPYAYHSVIGNALGKLANLEKQERERQSGGWISVEDRLRKQKK